MKTNNKYKWATPAEWLLERVSDGDVERDDMIDVIKTLLCHVSGDKLQNIYHAAMEEDGFFYPLCAECGAAVPDGEPPVNNWHKDTCSRYGR